MDPESYAQWSGLRYWIMTEKKNEERNKEGSARRNAGSRPTSRAAFWTVIWLKTRAPSSGQTVFSSSLFREKSWAPVSTPRLVIVLQTKPQQLKPSLLIFYDALQMNKALTLHWSLWPAARPSPRPVWNRMWRWRPAGCWSETEPGTFSERCGPESVCASARPEPPPCWTFGLGNTQIIWHLTLCSSIIQMLLHFFINVLN